MHDSREKRFKREYIDTGRVQLVFRHLPLPHHRFAVPAAVGAICAGRQGKFWAMHDLLFRRQNKLDDQTVGIHADVLDLDKTAFRNCIGEATVTESIKADAESARELGLTGTPAFLIGLRQEDGRVRVLTVFKGAMPLIAFQRALDAALAVDNAGWVLSDRELTVGSALLGIAAAGVWALRCRRKVAARNPQVMI